MADINVYGTLNAQTGEGKVARASQIYDESKAMFQSAINAELKDGKVNIGASLVALAAVGGFDYDPEAKRYSREWSATQIGFTYNSETKKYENIQGDAETFSVEGLSEAEVARVMYMTSMFIEPYAWYPSGSTKQKIRCTGAENDKFLYTEHNARFLCYGQDLLEVFWLCRDINSVGNNARGFRVTDAYGMFCGCTNLRRTTIINVSNALSLNYMFTHNTSLSGCTKLEETLIKGLSQDISFADSPNLNLKSLQFLVQNARPVTTPDPQDTDIITVTLHPTAYVMHVGTMEPTSLDLRKAASAMRIRFTTTLE